MIDINEERRKRLEYHERLIGIYENKLFPTNVTHIFAEAMKAYSDAFDSADKDFFYNYFKNHEFSGESEQQYIDRFLSNNIAAKMDKDTIEDFLLMEEEIYMPCEKLFCILREMALFHKGIEDTRTILEFADNCTSIIEMTGLKKLSTVALNELTLDPIVDFIFGDIENGPYKGIFDTSETLKSLVVHLQKTYDEMHDKNNTSHELFNISIIDYFPLAAIAIDELLRRSESLKLDSFEIDLLNEIKNSDLLKAISTDMTKSIIAFSIPGDFFEQIVAPYGEWFGYLKNNLKEPKKLEQLINSLAEMGYIQNDNWTKQLLLFRITGRMKPEGVNNESKIEWINNPRDLLCFIKLLTKEGKGNAKYGRMREFFTVPEADMEHFDPKKTGSLAKNPSTNFKRLIKNLFPEEYKKMDEFE